jgi:RsiW-degrading membrane proteinase PrsW (M82 family)
MNLIVDIVLAMAAITALTVAVWIYLDKPVRSYSIAAFIWLFLVTIVFALSRVMINDGFTSTEMILVGPPGDQCYRNLRPYQEGKKT